MTPELLALCQPRAWSCPGCGYRYDEARGLTELGLPPGSPLWALPESWHCPVCKQARNDFVLIQD